MKTPVKLSDKLPLLADLEAFPERGSPVIRWGQMLRTTPTAAHFLAQARSSGSMVPLRDLARVRSGVVTRANAFFIVRELPFQTYRIASE